MISINGEKKNCILTFYNILHFFRFFLWQKIFYAMMNCNDRDPRYDIVLYRFLKSTATMTATVISNQSNIPHKLALENYIRKPPDNSYGLLSNASITKPTQQWNIRDIREGRERRGRGG